MSGPNLWKIPSWVGDISIALLWLLLGGEAVAQQSAPTFDAHGAKIIERGKFRLHKFAQAIGEETYEIRKQRRLFEVKSSFEFTDRGSRVPLAATLRFDSDFTPEQFEVEGKNSRFNRIDDFVSVRRSTVLVRSGHSEREETRPRQFFTISGYAPTAVQMMLLRYWRAHGSPDRLRVFPSGEVRIEHSRG